MDSSDATATEALLRSLNSNNLTAENSSSSNRDNGFGSARNIAVDDSQTGIEAPKPGALRQIALQLLSRGTLV